MNITLYLSDKIIDYKLPSNVFGSFSFDPNDDDSKLINIEAIDDEWYLYKTDDVSIFYNGKIEAKIKLVPNSFYVIKKNNIQYLLFVSLFETNNVLSCSYKDNFNIIIGTNNQANIIYGCPYIGNNMVKLSIVDGKINVEKNGNLNVYCNKNILNNKNINFGDTFELYGFKMIVLNGLVLIMNAKNRVNIESNKCGLFAKMFEKNDEIKDIDVKDIDLYQQDDYYSKSPRFRRIIKTKEIKLTPPPSTNEEQSLPFFLTLAPMLTMGIISLTMFANVIQRIVNKTSTIAESWPQLLSSIAMLASMILWPIITKRYEKKLKEKKKEELILKYTNYLNEKEKEIIEEEKEQKIILQENLISIEECIKLIEHKSIGFWDKRIDQSDFLVARIGTGNEKLDLKLQYNEEDFSIEESELRKKADELAQKYKYINNVPIGYSFYDNRITAIMGNHNQTIDFINGILLQMISFYTYEDLKIVLFTNEKNKNKWDYLKYLNHNFSNDRSFRFFSSDQESARNVTDYLSCELNRRLQTETKIEHHKPHYFIIVDGYDNVKRYNLINDLTEIDEQYGFSVLFAEDKMGKLPSKCNNFIILSDGKSELLKNSYENQERTIFNSEIHSNLNMSSYSKKLSNIPIEFEEGIKQLPNSITFLEMEKVGKVEQLNILNRWQSNDSTESLKAEIGVDEQGDLMYLDLHEKYHGPHGLIAGMTGSGKSEFIITYILSMAINYSPDDVNFILIDYKGGGLAFAFENKSTGVILPHLAGTITNLDKAEMDRTLVSIDSEIKRRQQKFNEARDLLGESTIDIYKYQKFYKDGKLNEPMPHLFIICDEFAELKSQQPDFMDNLISVARIGRSLGVHLILATQKPSGVVNDQIWSNTKFRVCLKVQDESDSKEMLKRPEAASLKQTGRFYLQVGFDEYFALGQSGWCGAKYFPSDKIVKQVDKSLNFINDYGNPIKNIQASSGPKIQAVGEQLSAIMNSIIEASKIVNKQAKKLWLDNIETETIQKIEEKYEYQAIPYNVKAIIGEYDAPEKQEQGIVTYDLLEDGNTIIYGTDGSEREMMLNSIIYSTVKNHTPMEINYYGIDYGSESLRRFASLPHFGGMVYASEDDKFNNLIKLIKEEFKNRKKKFANYGGEYKSYNETNTNKLPLMVIILNNYDSIYENNQSLYDYLPELVRDSERYGIIYIFTCDGTSSINRKIVQNCNNFYALKLKDSYDYSTIFGVRNKIVPRDIFGRGLLNNDGLHEYQTANIVDDSVDLNSYLINFVQYVNNENSLNANKIPVLPDFVRYNDIKNKLTSINSIPVGITKQDLEVCAFDFFANPGNIISSNKLNNIDIFLKSLIMNFTVIPNLNIFIVDPNKKIKINSNRPINYCYQEFDKFIDDTIEYLNKQSKEQNNSNNIIFVYNFGKFITKLNDKNKMNDFAKSIKENEKTSIIIIDGASKLKVYSFEPWFTSIFNGSDGIWIGKGISDQPIFRISTFNKEMTKEIKNNMGYIVTENAGSLCKLIDYISNGDVSNEE